MYNPKDIFTEGGYIEWHGHLFNLKYSLFHIQNDADDLHIDDSVMEVVYELQRILDSGLLHNGDGEIDD